MRKQNQLRFLLPLLFLGIVVNGISQTTIFSENIGGPTATTTIAAYTGWQNNGVLTFSNGGVALPADVRNTSASTTYAGASGTGNVFFTATSGIYGLSIESINAAAFNNINLQFGYRKESATLHAAFSVEYWDGAAWVVIANTAATLFNEAGNAATGWYLSKILSLPPAAQINALKIRFVKSGAASIRVDDIKLTGQIATPTTTSISPSFATAGDPGFTITVNGTGFSSTLSTITWNGANRTTSFVNATQLTAAIPATDISTAGVANVGVTTTGAAAVSNTQLFIINAASGGTLTLTAPLAGFGNACINTTTAANSFTLDGNNLDGSPIALAPLTGFTYAETPAGPYTTTSFTYTGNSFTGKIIYVKFSPTVVQSYNGNIILSGGGITNYPIAATGAGINNAPAVTTGTSTAVGTTTATLAGTINDIGCAAITTYGIEYSTTSGFLNGTGIPVAATNLFGGNFSVNLTGLIPNTRYYYKAYATNSIGTTYGTQQFFTNTPLPVPMALQPGLSYTENFADIANWSNFFITGTGANHFGGLSAIGTGGIPNGTTITTSTSLFQGATFGSSGGVQKGTDQIPVTQSIVLLSTGATDNTSSAAIDFYMDFTGVNAGTLSFDWVSVNNATGDRNGSMKVYTSTDGILFTELTFATVLNFTNNAPTNGSKANIALPASFNNSATARLRFYYYNGTGGITPTGSRPKIAIDNLKVTAVATTPCASPTAAATNLTFGTITDVSIAGSFTAATPASDGYVVVVSANSSLTSNPVDGLIYNIGDNLGDGTVVANGNGTNFTATGLTALTTYYFFVFPVNSVCTGGPKYYTTSVLNGAATTVAGLPPCTTPATQPTNLTFGTVTTNTIQGSFTATTADEYLVLRSTSLTLSNNPVTATVYNTGDVLGNAVVVQRGVSTSFMANGLAPNTPYYFFVFSLNSSSCINGPVYIVTAPLNGTQTTQPLPPCTTPTAQPTSLAFTAANTSVSGTFTGVVDADDYVVIRSLLPTLSASPVDNTDYNVGDNFGGGIVVTNNSNTSFIASGLTANITYYFYIFAANKNCSGGTKYATGAALSGNITTGNAPVNNFYFGTLHSHSDYSDGNTDHPGFTPADDYADAMTAQCMDYLGISEHNHFEAETVLANYHSGVTQANTFTTNNPNFLALYGMEWGTIGTGGHVLIYGDGMDNLWGWESGSGLWGASNNYDTYVPKGVYTGNTGLFKTVNDNIATNTFASLAHPDAAHFNNLANSNTPYDAAADNAITAVAVESGPSTSANTTYSNPAFSMGYLLYYQTLLAKGYHVGPTIDHDNHKTTFGKTTYSRTAIVAPALTKTAIVTALRNMNFYATQDCDAKVDFSINTRITGSVFTDRFAPNITASITDATIPIGTIVIRLMYGAPGSGILPVKVDSIIGTALNFTDINLANFATGYYYLDINYGATGRIVTAPIWYTRNDLSAPLPIKLSSFLVQKTDNTARISWTTEQEINTSHFIIERSIDGRNWNSIATLAASGNSNHNINYEIYDNAPVKGINYYRLRQVDKDGRFEFSTVRSALFNSRYNIEVAPNPAKDFINLYVAKNGTQPKAATIQLLNAEGKIVYNTVSVQSHIQINTTGLSKGLYFVKVINADEVTTVRVLVQ
jgi:hypothetical protein